MELVALLAEKNETLSLAESLTGGMIADAVVSMPGASRVFFGGVVSYTDKAKHDLLSVSSELLLTKGAVSAEVAEEMARGAARVFGTSLAVSATGIAGPDGGTEKTPVGCVYIGLCHRGAVRSFRCDFSGTRREIREKCRDFVLSLVEKELTKSNLYDKI